MANKKFSEITPSPAPPAITDQLVGVGGGTSDLLYTVAQVQKTVGGRLIVTASITYYIRTTGNDINDGLTPATAWLTLAKAINYVNTQIDVQPTALASVDITIDVGPGVFAGVVTDMDFSNSEGGNLIINGDGIGSTTITDALQLAGIGTTGVTGANLIVQNLKLQATAGSPPALFRCKAGIIQNCEFALLAGVGGLRTRDNVISINVFNCTVSGSGTSFVHIADGNVASISVSNITYSTPTFSDEVFYVGLRGLLADNGTNVGSATGKRYVCNGVLFLGYGGASIQAGVGTVNGTMGATGQVQDANGGWHGNIATPVP